MVNACASTLLLQAAAGYAAPAFFLTIFSSWSQNAGHSSFIVL
jgi:hypothetical protein